MTTQLARLALTLALLGLGGLSLGCSEHLLGTHDVEIDYEVLETRAPGIDGASPAVGAEAARNPILRRLAAAQINADVEPSTARHLRITVEEDAADGLDEMLAWRGGLAVYRLDPAYVFTPRDLAGLVPRASTAKDGTIERYFTGSRDAVAHAVRAATVDADHRVLLEWVDPYTARTRVVRVPFAADLKSAVERVTVEGATMSVFLRTKEAEGALPQNDLEGLRGVPTCIALGRSVLAVDRLPVIERAGDGATVDVYRLTIELERDLYGYARARRLSLLLATPTLPPLARAGTVRAPANYPLATACVVLPLLLSLAWIFFVRRFDRAHPEPWWLVLATFGLGGLSVIPAGLAEYALQSASPYLNPSLMTLGGQLVAFPLALGVFTFVVGMSEEASKFLGAWALAAHRREFDEPVDGIIYGAVSALGFAAVENMKYFAVGRLSPALVVARTFTSIPAHMFFGAIWGYALGMRLVSKKTSVLLFLGWAALMHGAFDTVLSIDGLHLLALVLNLALATTFVILLRRALRHGRITPEMSAVSPGSRTHVRVGSFGIFAAAAVSLHVLAALVALVGGVAQGLHLRVGFGLVGVSSALLALLALSAWWVSAALPLDVAIDDYGVTFAGAARPWSSITRFERRPFGGAATIEVFSTAGDVTLGPGSRTAMDAIARALTARRVDVILPREAPRRT